MINNKVRAVLSLLDELPHEGNLDRPVDPNLYDPTKYLKSRVMMDITRPISKFLNCLVDLDLTKYLENLPPTSTKIATRSLDAASSILKQVITSFKVQPKERIRENLDYNTSANSLQESMQGFIEVFSPLVASNLNHSDQAHQASRLRNEVVSQLTDQLATLREEKEKALTIINAAENLGHLDEVIKVHRNYMVVWLLMLVLASLLTTYFLCWAFGLQSPTHVAQYKDASDVDVASIVLVGVGKLVIASFAIGFCVICSRNYQNHVHNYIVNQHRKAAAISFVQMATNPALSQFKPDLVKHAMEAIFAVPTTGFLSKFHNDFQSLNPVLNELVKKIGK